MIKDLSIGTVCKTKNQANEIMILGYKPVAFIDDKIVTYDYYACNYPEGLLDVSSLQKINKDDIENVIFYGYSSNKSSKLFDKLEKEAIKETKTDLDLKDASKEENKNNTSNDYSQFKFDENGVVIFDPFSSKQIPEKVESVDYIFDASTNSPYVFDENGVIISDNTVDNSQQPSNQLSNSQYKFDENGVVIADNTIDAKSLIPSYVFDDNGVIISDNTVA